MVIKSFSLLGLSMFVLLFRVFLGLMCVLVNNLLIFIVVVVLVKIGVKELFFEFFLFVFFGICMLWVVLKIIGVNFCMIFKERIFIIKFLYLKLFFFLYSYMLFFNVVL